MKYLRLPIEVEAVVWTGSNLEEVKAFVRPIGVIVCQSEGTSCLVMSHRCEEDRMVVCLGNLIVRCPDADVSVWDAKIFAERHTTEGVSE